MNNSEQARLIIQGYILTVPLWWVLGLDFITFQICAVLLVAAFPEALRRLTLGDYTLLAIIATLGASAYLVGFLTDRELTRFVAALYNLSFWMCGLVLILQVRHIWSRSDHGRLKLLRTGHLSFLVLLVSCWGFFGLAYAIGKLSLITPSVLGLLVGDSIPDSAPLIQRYASLVYTLVDWGLPGVPMPRVQVLGPYPTATAATAAVLGCLSLMYLNARRPKARMLPVLIEGAILLTIAITLTRSILGGWILGAVAANLLFGSTLRRIGALLAAGLMISVIALGILDLSKATDYRDYSSESRFDSYAHAIDKTIASNPIIGLGIKPREESHIAVGSHSTLVSAFTKGGVIGLVLTVLFLYLRPAWRWGITWLTCAVSPRRIGPQQLAELRILFNLQIALWIWLCFEDLDAPATAAALIFIAIALIEQATSPAILVGTTRRQAATKLTQVHLPAWTGASP